MSYYFDISGPETENQSEGRIARSRRCQPFGAAQGSTPRSNLLLLCPESANCFVAMRLARTFFWPFFERAIPLELRSNGIKESNNSNNQMLKIVFSEQLERSRS